MPYENIDALIQHHVSILSLTEQVARLAAQSLLNAVEARLFPEGVPAASPRTIYLMDLRNDSWVEVNSTQDLATIRSKKLIFAIGVRFFDATHEIADVILPVTLTPRGEDADVVLGSQQISTFSTDGNYARVADLAETLIAEAVSSWVYDRRGEETIYA